MQYSELGHQCIGFIIVHAEGLGESLGDESGLVACYGTVCIVLEVVSPLASDDVGTLWWADDLPGAFASEFSYLTAHGFLPMGPISAGACLCFAFGLDSSTNGGGHSIDGLSIAGSGGISYCSFGYARGQRSVTCYHCSSLVCMCWTYWDGLFGLAPCPLVIGVGIS